MVVCNVKPSKGTRTENIRSVVIRKLIANSISMFTKEFWCFYVAVLHLMYKINATVSGQVYVTGWVTWQHSLSASIRGTYTHLG